MQCMQVHDGGIDAQEKEDGIDEADQCRCTISNHRQCTIQMAHFTQKYEDKNCVNVPSYCPILLKQLASDEFEDPPWLETPQTM